MHDDSNTPGLTGIAVRADQPLTHAEAECLGRRYVAAYNTRDLDALLAMLDEHVVIHPSPLFERRPHYTGHAGVREWWETMRASGRWYEVVVNGVRQLESDKCGILGEIRHDGELLSPWAVLLDIRDSLIIESRSYLSDEDLLRELRLLQ
jgi:hypothetical protein